MIDGTKAFVLAILAVSALFVLNRRKKAIGENGKPFPPAFPALPVVGSLPYVTGGMDVLPAFFMKTAEKLGPVFTFYAGTRMTVVLNGKQAVRDAAVKHAEAFADKPGFWTEAKIFNTRLKGLAFAHYTDTFKKNQRIVLTGLKELGHGIGQVTEERILQQVDDLFQEFRKLGGRSFDPKDIMITTASGIVLNVLFGRKFQFSGTGHKSVVDNASTFVEHMDPAIDMAPILRFLPMYRSKISIMSKSIIGLMKGLDEGVQFCKAPDAEFSLVKRFLEIEGSSYDHEDLLYILRDCCLGGTETIASTVLWSLVEMASHPQIQNRLQKDVDEMIPGNRSPTLADKPHLPYVEAMTLELMRRHTAVPLSLPHATSKDTEACGFFVPKGCLVMMNIYSVHMDPEVWNDPENFRPERFLDEEDQLINRDNVIAFGQGRRTCVAELLARQELFLILASIVQHFDVLPPEGQSLVIATDRCGLSVGPSEFKVRLVDRRKQSMPPSEQ